jgi:hypothetical protein
MRSSFLHNVRYEMIAAQHSSRRIQEHEVRSAIRERERRQGLQGQGKTRLGKDRTCAAPRKSQAKESVTADALRLLFTVPCSIQRAGNGGSIR